jgi:LysM repeat protein
MSNNAPGFPHAFVRTSSPLRSRAGAFEGRWIAGLLRESAYFDADESNDNRYLSGLALTFQPAFDPGLTVGLARAVYGTSGGPDGALAHSADVLARWNGTRDAVPGGSGHAQITSLFARWIVAPVGAEVYGEWARHELPTSLRDLLVEPNHTQGYTVGLQWVGAEHGSSALRFQAEATSVEQSPTYRRRAVETYYTSDAVPQGYTHRGQVVGAAIGPGASSQWAAADYLAGTWRLGVSGGRVRWDNDAYYERPAAWGWLGHDVSLYGGIRGSYSTPRLVVQAELSSEKRYNYLFQNFGYNWETADSAVDRRNNMLRLSLSPAAWTRPTPPPLRLAPPPPVEPAQPALVPVQPSLRDATAPAPAPGAGDTASVADPGVAAPPEPLARPRPGTPADSLSRGAPRTHTVAAGETFFGIARAHGVAVEALAAANPGVDPGRIRPAQVLRLPAPTPAPQARPGRHRVAPGETLEGIARRYGLPREAIRGANGLRGDRIVAGQELVIPASY